MPDTPQLQDNMQHALRMLDAPSLFGPQQRIDPAQDPNQAGATAAAHLQGTFAPAQQQPMQRRPVWGCPPPGFDRPQHSSSNGMQQPVPAPPAADANRPAQNGPQRADAAVSAPLQQPFRADVPVSQPPAGQGYFPYGGQPQQQAPPQHPPQFHNGAQWQQPPVSPFDPQAAFYPPSAFGAHPQPQMPPPHAPVGPFAQSYEPYGAFLGPQHAFGAPPAPAGAFPPWQQQLHPQQQPYGHAASHNAAAMGLFALQQMAHQSKHRQAVAAAAAAAAAAAVTGQGYMGFPPNHPGHAGPHRPGHIKPPAGAMLPRAITPPPPPRPGMPMQGGNLNAGPARPRPPQPPPYRGAPQNFGYGGYAGPTQRQAGGHAVGYAGFGSRPNSGTWQHQEVPVGAEARREEHSSYSGAGTLDLNPLLAALPRSSSALWEPSLASSPRCSNSNLRKSSSCDNIPQRMGPDAPAHQQGNASTAAVAVALAPKLIAVARALSAATSGGGSSSAAGGEGSSKRNLSSWLSPRGSPADRKASARASPVKDDTSTGQAVDTDHDPPGATFISAVPSPSQASRTSARFTTSAERYNSSGGGSLFGRVSSRSLAWDPLSMVSSGGGAKPSPLAVGAPSAGNLARSPAKPCAVAAAKIPLVYTPVLGQSIWGGGIMWGDGSAGEAGGFGFQGDLGELQRRLRMGVRGPDARPI